MTKVEIKEKCTVFVGDLDTGDLFRDKDGHIYLMTDESDCDGNMLTLPITTTSRFGMLQTFFADEKVTKLDGTISVEIY